MSSPSDSPVTTSPENPPLDPAVSRYMAEQGRIGGASTSEKKRKASARNGRRAAGRKKNSKDSYPRVRRTKAQLAAAAAGAGVEAQSAPALA